MDERLTSRPAAEGAAWQSGGKSSYRERHSLSRTSRIASVPVRVRISPLW